MSSENKTGKAPLIATIVVAAVAAAAVVILLVFMNNKAPDEGSPSAPSEIVFSATPELLNECENAASALVSANYEVIRLFVTEGLPVKTVYGKIIDPIDGAYVIESDRYTEYSQIEALVKSIYTDETAEKILKETEVSFGGVTRKLQIYADHNVYGDVFFGLNEQFIIDWKYDTDWSDCYIVTEPKNRDSCELTIYVNGFTAENASDHPESVLKAMMIRTDNGWRLSEFLK